MMNKYLVKAAEQTLSEVLGYDEGRAYYLLLNKKEQEIEKEFSYSKKYRLMKSLFDLGAMAKIKPGDKDFYSYIILPPTFLYSEKVDKDIIEYLEKIYLENFKEIFNQNFSQFILKDEKILLLFLLKYFMKDEAKLITDELDIKYLGKLSSKIIINREGNGRRVGIIDKSLAFDFVSVMNQQGCDYIGYIARKSKENDYVSLVEEELGSY